MAVVGISTSAVSTFSSTLTDSTLRPRPNIARVTVILGRARVDGDWDATRAPLGILRANERREDTDRAEIDAVEVAIGASRAQPPARSFPVTRRHLARAPFFQLQPQRDRLAANRAIDRNQQKFGRATKALAAHSVIY